MNTIAYQICKDNEKFSIKNRSQVDAAYKESVLILKVPTIPGADAPQGNCSMALVFRDGSWIETGKCGYFYPCGPKVI